MIASVAKLEKTSNAPTSPGCLSTLPPYATHAAKSTAATIPATASPNSTISRIDMRRAAACCSKKFMRGTPISAGDPGVRPSELHLRRRAHLRLVGRGYFEQRRWRELEHAGDDARW